MPAEDDPVDLPQVQLDQPRLAARLLACDQGRARPAEFRTGSTGTLTNADFALRGWRESLAGLWVILAFAEGSVWRCGGALVGQRLDILACAQEAARRELELAVSGGGLELGFGRLDDTFPVAQIGVH